MNIDTAYLNQWVGKEEVTEDIITAKTANLMNATLSRDAIFNQGDVLPPAWHWLYFHQGVRGDDLGADGHAKLGGFIPPIPLPRRMWAGGTLRFEQPLRIGDHATKHSTIKSITPKHGRSGQLCFVIVEHKIIVNEQRCLSETQTLVYREEVQREAGQPPKVQQMANEPTPTKTADFSNAYTPDAAQLFRYSALTFNSHRIHYDLDFCRKHEGYPDLVIHGPLIATLLLDLFYQRQPTEQPIRQFDYRGVSPLFHPHTFTVNGAHMQDTRGEGWATNHFGGVAMTARVMV
ncbi:MAG: MaoC family dehydratase N-terminal domain-containing protein [Chloroflexota bacterium]